MFKRSALLMGGLWQTILEIINPDCVWLALIHGAVIARGGNGIALCAPSGSGKTTLTAALINGGFDYFADDLVALTAPKGTVLPWPLPLGVKSGSETLLAPYCPGLAQARKYRAKGIDARLLIRRSRLGMLIRCHCGHLSFRVLAKARPRHWSASRVRCRRAPADGSHLDWQSHYGGPHRSISELASADACIYMRLW